METTKARIKIPQLSKVKAELQKEIQSACPFCNNTDVGHFEIHHIDEDPSNNEKTNLFLLCPLCHSKITKGDIKQLDVLKKKINLIQRTKEYTSDNSNVNFNGAVSTAIIGSNNTISVKQLKTTVKSKYPEGSLGFDTLKANYVSYLIARYNEYKEYEVGKEKMRYGIFGAALKKQFKIGPTRTIFNLPIDRFDELVIYIQKRINSTTLAKIKGKAHKNFRSFDEYQALGKD